MKEKTVEREIQNFLLGRGHWCENLQSGKILVKKGPYSNYVHLCTAGCPDLVAIIKGKFVAIETKKDAKEHSKWLKMESRYRGEGKAPPMSAQREIDQITHKDLIIKNGGDHILTYSLNHFLNFYQEYE